MALLPDEPRKQYRFLALLLMAGLGALYWLYAYSPRAAELDEKEDRLSRVETRLRTARARSSNLEKLRADLTRYERQLAALRRLVPGRSEVARLYETIATESQSTGLELVSVTPSDARPDSAGHYRRQSWQMQVEGEYHAVGRFLTRVASLDRIVRPAVESIQRAGGGGSAGDGGGPPVSVRMTLETYVLADTASAGGRGGGDD